MKTASVSKPITPSLMSVTITIDEDTPEMLHVDVYRGASTVEFWSLDLNHELATQADWLEVSPHLTAFEFDQVKSWITTQFSKAREVFMAHKAQQNVRNLDDYRTKAMTKKRAVK